MTEKTTLELAQAVDPRFGTVVLAGEVIGLKAIDAFAALVEQRQIERLMGEKVEPVAWEGGEAWEPLAWALCAEENGEEACDELLWEGGAVKEPWGSRYLKYEGEARRMISLVHKHAFPAEQCAAMVQQAMPKRLTREQVDEWCIKRLGRPASILEWDFAASLMDTLGIPKESNHG